jgi:hypothetical protein
LFIYAIIIHHLVPLLYWVRADGLTLNLPNDFAFLLKHIFLTKCINFCIHLHEGLGHGFDGSIGSEKGAFLSEKMVVVDGVTVDTKGNFSEIAFKKY